MQSQAERLANKSKSEQAQFFSSLSDDEALALLSNWRGFLARPEQVEPEGDWSIWLCLAGRGWGKTETGAQWVNEQALARTEPIALIAETQKDLEEVMVARLLAINPEIKARYKPVRLEWPNGTVALGYNGTEPNQLRGPQFGRAWVDELAKYRYARETWDMLKFTMRLGDKPRILVTTTPRPTELVKSIVAGQEGKAHVTRGTTLDNAANLADSFIEDIYRRYEGTRLGRQELSAEILGDLPGALWSQSVLDSYRVREAPELERIVVAVDPAVTNEEDSDEHGIVVAGIDEDQTGYLIEDSSMQGTPLEWARAAVKMASTHDADGVVVEVNQGGDMVAHVLRSIAPNLNIIEVRATRGKHVRAEPISALYEQGRVRHVGNYPQLESQMTQMTTSGYQGGGSPDRLDALVWAFTELFPDMTQEMVNPAPAMPRRSRGWMGR